LKGEVRIEQTLQDDALFETGRRVMLSAVGEDAGGGAREQRTALHTEIESFRRQHGRCVMKFRGIDSISEAEKYIGREVRISADTLPVLQEGWFYTFQLKGCRVFGTNGEFIGAVTDILDSGGTEILKVDCDDQETLIPFAQSYLKKIDLERRIIEVDLPEGLRDLNK
jgi:16S rRNA processing protein RimM